MVALSRELFGNAITLRVTEDPELAVWTHIAIHARLTGNFAEAVDKQEKWCDTLLESIGDAAYSFTLLAGFA